VETFICRVEEGSGQRCLEGAVTIVGEDVVVTVGGGQRPHVGCVVLAAPYPAKRAVGEWSASCSVLTIPPHKEEPIARGIAVALATGLGRVTVVTAGVHDDNIDGDGIRTYLRLGEELAETLLARLKR
jgi:hypothetical protein